MMDKGKPEAERRGRGAELERGSVYKWLLLRPTHSRTYSSGSAEGLAGPDEQNPGEEFRPPVSVVITLSA